MRAAQNQRISEQARARAGFHASAWHPYCSPCLPASSQGPHMWACTSASLVGTHVAGRRRVLHRAPRAANLTTWQQVSLPALCLYLSCSAASWGEGRESLVGPSPPKAAMHLPLGSSVRCLLWNGLMLAGSRLSRQHSMHGLGPAAPARHLLGADRPGRQKWQQWQTEKDGACV